MIIIKQMSLGQLASGIIGAICYWDTTQGLFEMFFHPGFGAEFGEAFKFQDLCDIGFNWVRTSSQILHVVKQFSDMGSH